MPFSALVGKLAFSSEPLYGPSTREANRALLVTSLLVVLVSLQIAKTSHIPGIPAEIIGSRAIVAAGLLASQLAFLLMFAVNLVSDIQRVLILEARRVRDDALRRYDHLLRLSQEEGALKESSLRRKVAAEESFQERVSQLQHAVLRIQQNLEALEGLGETGSRFSQFSAETRIQMTRLQEAQAALSSFERSISSQQISAPGQLELLANEFVTRTDDALALEADISTNRILSFARRVKTIIDITLGPIVTIVAWIVYLAI